METFEIHITADHAILEVGTKLGVKTISIDLLQPGGGYHRTEYMTSAVRKFDSYATCKKWVDWLVERLKEQNVHPYRVKIESPYYPHYKDQSCYIESHFAAEDDKYPVSRNCKKTERLATDRVYDKRKYDDFRKKYEGVDVELCLYDTNPLEDFDWFKLYNFCFTS